MQPTPAVIIDPEFHSLIKPLADDELQQLEGGLVTDGCQDALVLWKGHGILLDGHNRLEICQRLNIQFKTREQECATRDDAIAWIIGNQFGRRNLSIYDRGKLALRLESIFKARAKANQVERKGGQRGTTPQKSAKLSKPVETRKELAKVAGVSHDTIDKVKFVEEHGGPAASHYGQSTPS